MVQTAYEPDSNSCPLRRRTKLVSRLNHLFDAKSSSTFLQARFVGQKRFALEGAEDRHRDFAELIDRLPSTMA